MLKDKSTLTPLARMLKSTRSIINTIVDTHLWQAAFVRPFPSGQDNWKTRTGSALAYVFGLLVFVPFATVFLINDYFVNYIPLSEMPTQSGKLVHISSCYRCDQYFLIEGPDEILHKFGSSSIEKLRPYIGDSIKVWYQRRYQIPLNTRDSFASSRNDAFDMLIEKNKKYINGYEAYRLDRVAMDKTDHWWAIAFLLLGLGLPVWIVVKYW